MKAVFDVAGQDTATDVNQSRIDFFLVWLLADNQKMQTQQL